jgi:hypothetical protein
MSNNNSQVNNERRISLMMASYPETYGGINKPHIIE